MPPLIASLAGRRPGGRARGEGAQLFFRFGVACVQGLARFRWHFTVRGELVDQLRRDLRETRCDSIGPA